MKTVYLDPDFKCHVTDDGTTMIAVETDFFDGKCDAYIEGYRFVPAGETWTREDGETFTGEMIAPWKPWDELDKYQRAYERDQLAQYAQEISELDNAYAEGVNSV